MIGVQRRIKSGDTLDISPRFDQDFFVNTTGEPSQEAHHVATRQTIANHKH